MIFSGPGRPLSGLRESIAVIFRRLAKLPHFCVDFKGKVYYD
jgi:hypothetical protein